MCRLTLAWVTSKNSTSNWSADILTRSSSLDPIFSAGLTAPVSGVNSCPWFHANSSADSPLCCPAANCLSAPFSNQLSFASPYHFRIRRDFRSKNPLSGFAPNQTKESSTRATHMVLHRGTTTVLKKWFWFYIIQEGSYTIDKKTNLEAMKVYWRKGVKGYFLGFKIVTANI